MNPRISLDQWRALLAVVDAGGYAQAAEALHKSQSTVSYAVQKLEQQLGVAVFEQQGRRSVLTPTGELLHRRARLLVEEATELEQAARRMADGREAVVRIGVDHLVPTPALFQALGQFSDASPDTRVELFETVLSGNEDVLLQHRVDLAVTPIVPVGFLGNPVHSIEFIAVAHPEHPLHRLDRTLTYKDLRRHRQLVIRDSGSLSRDAGWLGAEQRWTVSHMRTSILAARMGLGFAWFPSHVIADELAAGQLQPLPLAEGAVRHAELYLVFAEPDCAGPAARELAALLTCALGAHAQAGSG